jgi:hypothetical protein
MPCTIPLQTSRLAVLHCYTVLTFVDSVQQCIETRFDIPQAVEKFHLSIGQRFELADASLKLRFGRAY